MVRVSDRIDLHRSQTCRQMRWDHPEACAEWDVGTNSLGDLSLSQPRTHLRTAHICNRSHTRTQTLLEALRDKHIIPFASGSDNTTKLWKQFLPTHRGNSQPTRQRRSKGLPNDNVDDDEDDLLNEAFRSLMRTKLRVTLHDRPFGFNAFLMALHFEHLESRNHRTPRRVGSFNLAELGCIRPGVSKLSSCFNQNARQDLFLTLRPLDNNEQC